MRFARWSGIVFLLVVTAAGAGCAAGETPEPSAEGEPPATPAEPESPAGLPRAGVLLGYGNPYDRYYTLWAYMDGDDAGVIKVRDLLLPRDDGFWRAGVSIEFGDEIMFKLYKERRDRFYLVPLDGPSFPSDYIDIMDEETACFESIVELHAITPTHALLAGKGGIAENKPCNPITPEDPSGLEFEFGYGIALSALAPLRTQGGTFSAEALRGKPRAELPSKAQALMDIDAAEKRRNSLPYSWSMVEGAVAEISFEREISPTDAFLSPSNDVLVVVVEWSDPEGPDSETYLLIFAVEDEKFGKHDGPHEVYSGFTFRKPLMVEWALGRSVARWNRIVRDLQTKQDESRK